MVVQYNTFAYQAEAAIYTISITSLIAYVFLLSPLTLLSLPSLSLSLLSLLLPSL
jgi:hypothetical protein